MNKTILFIFFVLSVIPSSFAQLNQAQQSNSMVLSDGIGVGENLFISSPYKKQIRGTTFLFEDWKKGSLSISGTNKIYTTDSIKYDVLNNSIDVTIADEIKTISGNYISEFKIYDGLESRKYVKGNMYYTPEGAPIKGFVELIYEHDDILLAHPYVYSKQATYNQALMMGEKDDVMMVKEEYYYIDQNRRITRLKKKRNLKKIAKLSSCNISKITRTSLINCLKKNE